MLVTFAMAGVIKLITTFVDYNTARQSDAAEKKQKRRHRQTNGLAAVCVMLTVFLHHHSLIGSGRDLPVVKNEFSMAQDVAGYMTS